VIYLLFAWALGWEPEWYEWGVLACSRGKRRKYALTLQAVRGVLVSRQTTGQMVSLKQNPM
jgi:hypothetical protein